MSDPTPDFSPEATEGGGEAAHACKLPPARKWRGFWLCDVCGDLWDRPPNGEDWVFVCKVELGCERCRA